MGPKSRWPRIVAETIVWWREAQRCVVYHKPRFYRYKTSPEIKNGFLLNSYICHKYWPEASRGKTTLHWFQWAVIGISCKMGDYAYNVKWGRAS